MHPRLPATTAAEYAFRGSMALQRRHEGGNCDLDVTFYDGTPRSMAQLAWEAVSSEDLLQLDSIRITEDGAEAIALALVNVARGWRVRRRLQRGESADWLLDGEPVDNSLVALEVSGIDGLPDLRRLAEKVQQVTKVTLCPYRCACVIAFAPPAASVAWA